MFNPARVFTGTVRVTCMSSLIVSPLRPLSKPDSMWFNSTFSVVWSCRSPPDVFCGTLTDHR